MPQNKPPPGPQPAFVVPPPNVIELLRGAKSFAPVLGRISIAAGTIIGLAPLAELAEQKIEDGIKRGLKKKTKRKKKDNQQVVKVKDAIDCVENIIRDPKLLLRTAREIVSIFTGEPRTIINVAVDEIAECIRSKALIQTAPRKRLTYRYSKREI